MIKCFQKIVKILEYNNTNLLRCFFDGTLGSCFLLLFLDSFYLHRCGLYSCWIVLHVIAYWVLVRFFSSRFFHATSHIALWALNIFSHLTT